LKKQSSSLLTQFHGSFWGDQHSFCSQLPIFFFFDAKVFDLHDVFVVTAFYLLVLFCSLHLFSICFCASLVVLSVATELQNDFFKTLWPKTCFPFFWDEHVAHDVVPFCKFDVPDFLKGHRMKISIPKKSQSWPPTSFLPGLLDPSSCSVCSFADLTCCEQEICHAFMPQLTGLQKCDMQRHVDVENQHIASFQVKKLHCS